MDPVANTIKTSKAGLDTTASLACAAGVTLIIAGNIVPGVIACIVGGALFAVKRFLL
jgi:ribose 5-phosphate isomerase RpiB